MIRAGLDAWARWRLDWRTARLVDPKQTRAVALQCGAVLAVDLLMVITMLVRLKGVGDALWTVWTSALLLWGLERIGLELIRRTSEDFKDTRHRLQQEDALHQQAQALRRAMPKAPATAPVPRRRL